LARAFEPFGNDDGGQFGGCAVEILVDNNIIKISEMRDF
jgi:hypothetical protein